MVYDMLFINYLLDLKRYLIHYYLIILKFL